MDVPSGAISLSVNLQQTAPELTKLIALVVGAIHLLCLE
jgi:hypothetical protein